MSYLHNTDIILFSSLHHYFPQSISLEGRKSSVPSYSNLPSVGVHVFNFSALQFISCFLLTYSVEHSPS